MWLNELTTLLIHWQPGQSLTFHIFRPLWNRWTEFSETVDRKQDLNVLYQVYVFFSEKQDGRPGLWLAETFLTSALKTADRNSTKLDRRQRPLASLSFSGRSEKPRWPPRPLIGWDIFDFSSNTAERNSTKLDRKQDINVLYQSFILYTIHLVTELDEILNLETQICVFRADRKKTQNGRPGLLLAETFSISL